MSQHTQPMALTIHLAGSLRYAFLIIASPVILVKGHIMERYLVYFFGTDFERVKIGCCKANLYNRQQQIQVGCPDPIKLLGVIQCKDEWDMKSTEEVLHYQFKEYNTIGEWFRLVPEISAYIEEFTESGKDILKNDHQQRRRNDKSPEERRRKSETDRRYRAKLREGI